jgi:transcriptional regulator with XRE-family HTH domain
LRSHREQKGFTQDEVAAACKTNRSAVAHLEQGLRLPKPDVLRRICEHLQIPPRFWEPFTRLESAQRFEFEDVLSELVGRPGGNLDGHDPASILTVEQLISTLFHTTGSDQQTLDLFNSILLFYGVRPVSRAFFERYLSPTAFSSVVAFDKRVAEYQKEAIRLFSALREAYNRLNAAGERLSELLRPLDENPLGPYHSRSDWNIVEDIEPARLPDLGYVSAARVRQEAAERSVVQRFLRELAASIRDKGPGPAVDAISEKQRRRIDSLLRKFGELYT